MRVSTRGGTISAASAVLTVTKTCHVEERGLSYILLSQMAQEITDLNNVLLLSVS